MSEPTSHTLASSAASGAVKLDLRHATREVWCDGRRVPMGGRAFAILDLLVRNRHRPVSKNEIFDSVWPHTVVEENNLQVHISSLRRLLGAQVIVTIPGRGYRCLAIDAEDQSETVLPPTRPTPRSAPPAPSVPVSPPVGNLSAHTAELIGREADRSSVLALIPQHALVTIAGTSGIGKTRLAEAVARAACGQFADGAWFVELAALHESNRVAGTIAHALRVELPGYRSAYDELVAAVRSQHLLLIIDSAEHLIDEVGAVVSLLLREAPMVRVLVTSQESLRLAPEQVHRLMPLAVPEAEQNVDPVSAAQNFGALRLFVERVRGHWPGFLLDGSNIAAVSEICRRLDGLPLAIELAAARVPVLGVEGVRLRLSERFRLLTAGSRVAPARHRTLHAALDWSHGLLDEDERAVCRRLGLFVGSFDVESAQDLAGDARIDAWAVLDHLGSLVDKSLVIVGDEDPPRYRMLESMRHYAIEQMVQAGETDTWMARHAATVRRTLERAIAQRRDDLVMADLANIRSAFAWATGPTGDAELAVALATLPAMVLAVEGAAAEAAERLLAVEPLIHDQLPLRLQALYWQWLGRVGLGARLPIAHTVRALGRAEALFQTLNNLRHVHACRRHLAEALLDAGDLDGAEMALQRAFQLEDTSTPVADRLRSLRVKGLLAAKKGEVTAALHALADALSMAESGDVHRYAMVLRDDIAGLHLQSGRPQEAARQYRELAERARVAPGGGLTLASALSGLVAALTYQDRLEEATRAAIDALHVICRSGIFLARADVLAHLMAMRQSNELAAMLLGASEQYRSSCQAERNPIEQRCHQDCWALLARQAATDDLSEWLAAGRRADQGELLAALRRVSV